ncbi:MAG TPA: DNA translocase FtsK [Ktedonobacteraceae bacterium]|nr:DNA translocase FtsK [Ktedonobacteraceae bacterium]
MAGGDQSRERRPRNGQAKSGSGVDVRVSTGSSRVSRAAGIVGSEQIRVEQRSSAPGSKSRSSGSKSTSGTSTRRTQGTRSASSGTRKNSPSGRSAASGTGSSKSQQPYTGFQGVLPGIWNAWQRVEPHNQRRVYSVLFVLLSLLLFSSLTFFAHAPVLSAFYGFFTTFFGWGAYLLAIGFIVFSFAHLFESFRGNEIIRWSFVIGLIVMGLIVLAESSLLIGGKTGGVVAALLASPLRGWPAPIGHILLFGLFCIATIVTFRLTLGHFIMGWQFLWQFLSGGDQRQERMAAVGEDDIEMLDVPDEYMGQRPRYSRYMGSAAPAAPTYQQNEYDDGDATLYVEQDELAMQQQGQYEEDDGFIYDDQTVKLGYDGGGPAQKNNYQSNNYYEDGDEYDDQYEGDEYDYEDDPLNDINIHKQKVGLVPKGHRKAGAIDREDVKAAIGGARQQNLPFQQEEPREPTAINLLKNKQEMDLLASNSMPSPAPSRTPVANKARSDSRRGGGQFQAESAAPLKANPVSSWKLPETRLLNSPAELKAQLLGDDTSSLAKIIQDTLRSFRVDAEVRAEDISIGPTVIRFGIRPTGKPAYREDENGKPVPIRDASGNIVYESRTRVSRIMALQNDLALVLEAKTVRMEAPVPGRPYVGVEIPNKNSRLVTLREVLESKEYQTARNKSKLAVTLGRDVAGLVKVGDLARMPHLLIAGATGAGKSVCVNAIIASILTQATPDDVRLLMVDPKMVELSMYNGIPHLLSPVVTEVEKVIPLLKNAITEMERRYRLFSQLGVRNLDGYRKMRLEKISKGDTSLNNLPAIVIIIDELADLMMAAPEEVEGMICRLAQLARATGIHLVVATQRPSVDVITGLIKANIPTRISFMVSSAVDSRTIIDMGGAERLLGRGDMLYLPADAGKPERIQGAFVADEEAEALVNFWRVQAGERLAAERGVTATPEQLPAQVEPGWEIKAQEADEFSLDDDLLEEAERVVREYEKASISLLQRRLRIGYSRAARLIDLLEERGVIGRAEQGGRSREVLEDGYGYNGAQTIADEVDDIVSDERHKQDVLKRVQARSHNSNQGYVSSRGADNEDDVEELDL